MSTRCDLLRLPHEKRTSENVRLLAKSSPFIVTIYLKISFNYGYQVKQI